MRTALLVISAVTAFAAVELRMAIVTSWGAYALDVSLAALALLVGLTAVLRVIALRGTTVGKFGVWMIIEALVVVAASIHDLMHRQPDLLPVMVAVSVFTDALAVGQLALLTRWTAVTNDSGPGSRGSVS